MNRQPSPWVAQQNAALVQRIQELKAEHPFWGDWRMWAYLRLVEQRQVTTKRVRRLMWEHQLLGRSHRPLQAKRTPMWSKLKPTKPSEWWGIDMTKVLVKGVGLMYSVVMLDWYTKTTVGYPADLRSTAQHWLAALDMAVSRQFPEGAEAKG